MSAYASIMMVWIYSLAIMLRRGESCSAKYEILREYTKGLRKFAVQVVFRGWLRTLSQKENIRFRPEDAAQVGSDLGML